MKIIEEKQHASGRKKALFDNKILGVKNRKEITKAVADYFYLTALEKEEYTEREYDRIINVLDGLIGISGELYNTKKSISNTCLEDIINKEASRTYFAKYLKDVYGTIFSGELADIVYYFVWYASQKTEEVEFTDPEYMHVEDMLKEYNDEQ